MCEAVINTFPVALWPLRLALSDDYHLSSKYFSSGFMASIAENTLWSLLFLYSLKN